MIKNSMKEVATGKESSANLINKEMKILGWEWVQGGG